MTLQVRKWNVCWFLNKIIIGNQIILSVSGGAREDLDDNLRNTYIPNKHNIKTTFTNGR